MSIVLELEIERAHFALNHRPRALWLLPSRRIVETHEADQRNWPVEIGTYTSKVELRDFRDDVFFCWERMRR